jgi:hypothetical protein
MSLRMDVQVLERAIEEILGERKRLVAERDDRIVRLISGERGALQPNELASSRKDFEDALEQRLLSLFNLEIELARLIRIYKHGPPSRA